MNIEELLMHRAVSDTEFSRLVEAELLQESELRWLRGKTWGDLENGGIELREAGAQCADLSADEVLSVYEHDEYTGESLLLRGDATAALIAAVAKTSSSSCDRARAFRMTKDMELVVFGLGDKDDFVRAECFQRLADQTEFMEKAAHDPCGWCRCVAADSKSTPPHLLTALANDKYDHARFCVAMNPASPDEALWALIRSGDAKDRLNVAMAIGRQPRSTEMTQALANDPSQLVRGRLAFELDARTRQYY